MHWTALLVALSISTTLWDRTPLRAQDRRDRPAFDIASVRENQGGATGTFIRLRPDAVRLENMPLRTIIGLALGHGSQRNINSFGRFQLRDGAFDKLLDRRFDIVATAPEGTTGREVRAMLLALLEERFQFRSHLETRQMPIYTLSVRRPGRLGPGVRPATIDCDETVVTAPTLPDAEAFRTVCVQTHRTPTSVGYVSTGTVAHLIGLAQGWVDRPIVDRTALEGLFEWSFSFRVDPFDTTTDAPTVFQAFEEELGLTLDAQDGPFEAVVVDNITPPSPN